MLDALRENFEDFKNKFTEEKVEFNNFISGLAGKEPDGLKGSFVPGSVQEFEDGGAREIVFPLGSPPPQDQEGGYATRAMCPPPAMRSIAPPSSSGRVRLLSYVEDTLERLAIGDGPCQDDLTQKIEPSVVNSIKRLSAAAPQELRTALKGALDENCVLPDYAASLEEFKTALEKCKTLLEDSNQEEDSSGNPEILAVDPVPTMEELQTLRGVVGRLWQIDEPYRLDPGRGFRLNHQSHAASLESMTDRCRDPLFESVDEEGLMKNPCSASFISLLDNYARDLDDAEMVTSTEKREMDDFMKSLMQTPHMRYAHNVLVAWGVASEDPNRFASKVFDIWFTQYRVRSHGPLASSGFEHVFVGEEKYDKDKNKDTIVGLHNWMQFWREEKAGKIDYRGYVGCITEDDERLVSVRFAWDDSDPGSEMKSVSTFLIGSSVAFEFAVATITFLGFQGDAKVKGIYFGDIGPVQLTTYAWGTKYGQMVRSAFIEA